MSFRPLDALMGLLLTAVLALGIALAVAWTMGEFQVREDLRWTHGVQGRLCP